MVVQIFGIYWSVKEATAVAEREGELGHCNDVAARIKDGPTNHNDE